jgi:hypothetical protein
LLHSTNTTQWRQNSILYKERWSELLAPFIFRRVFVVTLHSWILLTRVYTHHVSYIVLCCLCVWEGETRETISWKHSWSIHPSMEASISLISFVPSYILASCLHWR